MNIKKYEIHHDDEFGKRELDTSFKKGMKFNMAFKTIIIQFSCEITTIKI
jgi:hypothetical protein